MSLLAERGPISEEKYSRWALRTWGMLVSQAERRGCREAEDFATEIVHEGLRILRDDRQAFDWDTGQEGLARWLGNMLTVRIPKWQSRHPMRNTVTVSFDDDIIQMDRWERWLNDNPNPGMLEEALLRYRHAKLTWKQAQALDGMLRGWTVAKCAEILGWTIETVRWQRFAAVRVLKDVDIVSAELKQAPDMNHSQWLAKNFGGMGAGYIDLRYFKPTSQGARLWWEKLAKIK